MDQFIYVVLSYSALILTFCLHVHDFEHGTLLHSFHLSLKGSLRMPIMRRVSLILLQMPVMLQRTRCKLRLFSLF